MADKEKVLKGLECCDDMNSKGNCFQCPYLQTNKDEGMVGCTAILARDALELLKELDAVIDTAKAYENGEYDVLDLLSGAWHGKQYYFRERNGIIYSRDTCQYMTLDDAITEFANRLGDNGSI